MKVPYLKDVHGFGRVGVHFNVPCKHLRHGLELKMVPKAIVPPLPTNVSIKVLVVYKRFKVITVLLHIVHATLSDHLVQLLIARHMVR